MTEYQNGGTLLYNIMRLGDDYSQVAMLLLQHSAPIKGVSRTGNTALHYAAQAGMWAVIENLLLHDEAYHEQPISKTLSMRNSREHRNVHVLSTIQGGVPVVKRLSSSFFGRATC